MKTNLLWDFIHKNQCVSLKVIRIHDLKCFFILSNFFEFDTVFHCLLQLFFPWDAIHVNAKYS